jgi:hypothetical protein
MSTNFAALSGSKKRGGPKIAEISPMADGSTVLNTLAASTLNKLIAISLAEGGNAALEDMHAFLHTKTAAKRHGEPKALSESSFRILRDKELLHQDATPSEPLKGMLETEFHTMLKALTLKDRPKAATAKGDRVAIKNPWANSIPGADNSRPWAETLRSTALMPPAGKNL